MVPSYKIKKSDIVKHEKKDVIRSSPNWGIPSLIIKKSIFGKETVVVQHLANSMGKHVEVTTGFLFWKKTKKVYQPQPKSAYSFDLVGDTISFVGCFIKSYDPKKKTVEVVYDVYQETVPAPKVKKAKKKTVTKKGK